jgi:DNA-binding response OmpR family regulator
MEDQVERRRIRVLVVDDFPDTADVIRSLVEILGYECRVADSGRAALAVACDFEPTVVLLDIGLSDMNGCDVARELRARRGGDRMLIVALSGWGRPEQRREALAAGCDQYVMKPADVTKLRAILGAADPDRDRRSPRADRGL